MPGYRRAEPVAGRSRLRLPPRRARGGTRPRPVIAAPGFAPGGASPPLRPSTGDRGGARGDWATDQRGRRTRFGAPAQTRRPPSGSAAAATAAVVVVASVLRAQTGFSGESPTSAEKPLARVPLSPREGVDASHVEERGCRPGQMGLARGAVLGFLSPVSAVGPGGSIEPHPPRAAPAPPTPLWLDYGTPGRATTNPPSRRPLAQPLPSTAQRRFRPPRPCHPLRPSPGLPSRVDVRREPQRPRDHHLSTCKRSKCTSLFRDRSGEAQGSRGERERYLESFLFLSNNLALYHLLGPLSVTLSFHGTQPRDGTEFRQESSSTGEPVADKDSGTKEPTGV